MLAATHEFRYIYGGGGGNDSPCLQIAALFVNMGRSKGVPPLTPPSATRRGTPCYAQEKGASDARRKRAIEPKFCISADRS